MTEWQLSELDRRKAAYEEKQSQLVLGKKLKLEFKANDVDKRITNSPFSCLTFPMIPVLLPSVGTPVLNQ
nr:hypothetical protein [Dulcicalothrix desertica]